VIRLGALGDVVRTLPAVSALRAAYPRARITWLVEPASASVLAGQPWVDEVLVFPRETLARRARSVRLGDFARTLLDFVRALRSRRFDLVLDFHSILKSGLLSLASGAPVRVGYARPYAREGAWLLANARARLAPAHASRFERNAALVEFLGCKVEAAPRPLRTDPGAEARTLAALGGEPPGVTLHPGTSAGTPHKRYAPEAWAWLARALREEDGLSTLVTWGPEPGERELAAGIVAASDGAARLAPATASLAELAAIFARSRVYVGPDTGPMHIASLLGTPVVQILGPTDPLENAPWAATPSRTLRVQIGCNPCRRGCAAATCMRVLPPRRVLEAVRALLAGSPARVIESGAPGGSPRG
jgi:ADP-heptose:LPS heptosyltransferase